MVNSRNNVQDFGMIQSLRDRQMAWNLGSDTKPWGGLCWEQGIPACQVQHKREALGIIIIINL